MPYFSSEPKFPRGDIRPHPQARQRTALAVGTPSKAPMPIAVWNDAASSLESSLGAEWAAMNDLSPTAQLRTDLLARSYENKTLHFCKECFS